MKAADIFVTSPLDCPRKAYEVWRKGAQKFHCDDTSPPKSGHGYYFLLVEDLCSDVSSSWNFCALSSDLMWRWIQRWRREMSAVFTGYLKDSNLCFLSISYAYTRCMEILLHWDWRFKPLPYPEHTVTSNSQPGRAVKGDNSFVWPQRFSKTFTFSSRSVVRTFTRLFSDRSNSHVAASV